uniref:non-specific serine/threonine protein kinase n=1 Tax=Araucaria cunninghamii TaxID=56994 RepID=A0A0D6R7G9_ARACU
MITIARMILVFLMVMNAGKYVLGAGKCDLGANNLMSGGRRNRYLLQVANSYPPPKPGGKGVNNTKTVLLTGAAGIGGFFLVGALVLLLVCSKKICSHLKRKRDHRNPEQRIVVPVSNHEESMTFDPRLPSMKMSDLATATNDFDKNRVIGDGGFGLVYKAFLPNGTVVAVKKLSMDACQGIREFQAEMDTLGRIRHTNLVEILGYCVAGQERLLIYRFVENGSLDEWLHEREEPGKILDWRKRLTIMRGVAAGLSFLHNECHPHIIHRDIKASNILLDKNFEAKITDFGLARYINPHKSHISTQAAGTLGYMPPEYAGGSIATKPADVYSFGMLMLEIATGRRPNLHIKDANKKTLWNWVHGLVKEGRYMDLLDPSLRCSLAVCQHSDVEVEKFFEIACFCTAHEAEERPLMQEVVSKLAALVPKDMI